MANLLVHVFNIPMASVQEIALTPPTSLPDLVNGKASKVLADLVQVPSQTVSINATFVYDGDGTRVKSTIGSVTTYYVGNLYELTGGVATKYYYAGGQRIAMRQGGTLTYMLGDINSAARR